MHKKLSEKQFLHLFKFLELIGYKFTDKSKDRIESQLNRRLYDLRLASFDEYLYILSKYPNSEVPYLINAATINHTHFMREVVHYEYLQQKILPLFIKEHGLGGTKFKVWCAASSTGEEPYNLAMVIDEFYEKNKLSKNYEIYASDIDPICIERARSKTYPIKHYDSLPNLYKRLYTDVDNLSNPEFFKIKEIISNKITWYNINLKDDVYPFPSSLRFQVIFVRNVFIYFDTQEIEACVKRFSNLTAKNSHIILGQSENLYGIKSDWALIKNSIYKKNEQSNVIELNIKENKLNSSVEQVKKNKIKVLCVDDSVTVLKLLTKIINSKEDLEVIATKNNGKEALEWLKDNYKNVDIICSDINMPYMDGIELLKEQMKRYKIPTIMISAIAQEDAKNILKAYEFGAVDYLEKPKNQNFNEIAKDVTEKIKLAYDAKVKININNKIEKALKFNGSSDNKVVVIGSSTGGPQTLRELIKVMPPNMPPIVIAQHMPAAFTKAFAEQLNQLSSANVVEAKNNMPLEANTIYICPGGMQSIITCCHKGKYIIQSKKNDEKELFTPNIDTLFNSCAKLKSKIEVIAVLLTGMGADGAKELLNLKKLGHFTIAESEETAIVYGMPKAAKEIDAANIILPYYNIMGAIVESLEGKKNIAISN